MSNVTTDRSSNPDYATITIDRPDSGNAMSPAVIAALGDAIDDLAGSRGPRTIVVTGAGKTFSAGADVDVFADRADDPDAVLEYLEAFTALYERIEAVPKPVVARVNGAAYGGGYELAMACDVRYAATNAELCPAELRMGIVPPFERLALEVGEGLAREVCLTGGVLRAEDAADTDLFSRVIAPDELDTVIEEFARRIEARSPNAVAQTKRAMVAYRSEAIRRSASYRHALDEQCVRHPDFAESVAAFREDRTPNYGAVGVESTDRNGS